MEKTALLFDLDGTLLDTLEDLHDAVQYALGQCGYPRHTLEETRQFVGNGARRLLDQSVPPGENAEKALAIFQSYYQAHCQVKTKPYDGIMEALASLRQRYPVAIVSNKPDMAVQPLCARHFPGIYARGEGPDIPRKPAPDMVLQTLRDIGADRCLYIGDSEVDVFTAQNAGFPCLSVLWGFRRREAMAAAGAVHFCERPQDLVETIEEIIHGK